MAEPVEAKDDSYDLISVFVLPFCYELVEGFFDQGNQKIQLHPNQGYGAYYDDQPIPKQKLMVIELESLRTQSQFQSYSSVQIQIISSVINTGNSYEHDKVDKHHYHHCYQKVPDVPENSFYQCYQVS
jgi:hypothetical protein